MLDIILVSPDIVVHSFVVSMCSIAGSDYAMIITQLGISGCILPDSHVALQSGGGLADVHGGAEGIPEELEPVGAQAAGGGYCKRRCSRVLHPVQHIHHGYAVPS